MRKFFIFVTITLLILFACSAIGMLPYGLVGTTEETVTTANTINNIFAAISEVGVTVANNLTLAAFIVFVGALWVIYLLSKIILATISRGFTVRERGKIGWNDAGEVVETRERILRVNRKSRSYPMLVAPSQMPRIGQGDLQEYDAEFLEIEE